ncbi:MAG: hypothetical protein NTX46_04485 [Chloroflexi bacterium]|nr:hypothetical protein [Chloroflexota bacterium]
MQEIQRGIIGVFCREGCTLYEASLIIIQLTEQIDKLAQGKDPYESRFCQYVNKVESLNLEVPEDDIIAESIQKIVDEILEDIGDIFISNNLFAYECEMILAALAEKIIRQKLCKRGESNWG